MHAFGWTVMSPTMLTETMGRPSGPRTEVRYIGSFSQLVTLNLFAFTFASHLTMRCAPASGTILLFALVTLAGLSKDSPSLDNFGKGMCATNLRILQQASMS